MGCDSYVGGIMFSESDDDLCCLCTFPHNDGDTLDAERVRSLAYLGAAVVLQHNGNLKHPYLPACLPEWMRREIDRNIRLPNDGGEGRAASARTSPPPCSPSGDRP